MTEYPEDEYVLPYIYLSPEERQKQQQLVNAAYREIVDRTPIAAEKPNFPTDGSR